MSEEMTRKEVIWQLKGLLLGELRTTAKERKALEYAISSLETDEAYQLEYERTTKNDLAVSNGLENSTKKYCGCCKHWKRKGVKKIGDKPTSYGKCTKLSISGFEVETTYNDDCSSEGLE